VIFRARTLSLSAGTYRELLEAAAAEVEVFATIVNDWVIERGGAAFYVRSIEIATYTTRWNILQRGCDPVGLALLSVSRTQGLEEGLWVGSLHIFDMDASTLLWDVDYRLCFEAGILVQALPAGDRRLPRADESVPGERKRWSRADFSISRQIEMQVDDVVLRPNARYPGEHAYWQRESNVDGSRRGTVLSIHNRPIPSLRNAINTLLLNHNIPHRDLVLFATRQDLADYVYATSDPDIRVCRWDEAIDHAEMSHHSMILGVPKSARVYVNPLSRHEKAFVTTMPFAWLRCR
jgi:hypothetical protein